MKKEEAAERYIREKYLDHSLVDLLLEDETPVFVAGADWQLEQIKTEISKLRSKILHLKDRANDFEILAAFSELEDKLNEV